MTFARHAAFSMECRYLPAFVARWLLVNQAGSARVLIDPDLLAAAQLLVGCPIAGRG
jgi:hypothetical protein